MTDAVPAFELTVLLWTPPDHSVIRAAEQEADGHDC